MAAAAVVDAAPITSEQQRNANRTEVVVTSSQTDTTVGGGVDKEKVVPTDSVSRGYSDLNFPLYLATVGTLTAGRAFLQQPLAVALARKQACASHADRSTLSIVKQLYMREGGLRRGLYRGGVAVVVGTAASEMIYMGSFEYVREVLPISSSSWRDYCGGYVADATCRSVHIPFLVIGTRQMVSTSGPALNVRQTARSVYKEGGVRSLYAGLGATLVVGSQWTAVWWASYNLSKDALYGQYRWFLGVEDDDTEEDRMKKVEAKLGPRLTNMLPASFLSPTDNHVLNSIASCGTSALTALMFNPYLVIRTRLQAANTMTVPLVCKEVMAQSGIRGFWHGTVLNINTCILDAWLASTTYEWAKIVSDTSAAAA